MSVIRKKAHDIIDKISEKKISEVIDFLEYLKIKEEVEATNEILSDNKLLDSIMRGKNEAEKDELIDLKDVIENV